MKITISTISQIFQALSALIQEIEVIHEQQSTPTSHLPGNDTPPTTNK